MAAVSGENRICGALAGSLSSSSLGTLASFSAARNSLSISLARGTWDQSALRRRREADNGCGFAAFADCVKEVVLGTAWSNAFAVAKINGSQRAQVTNRFMA